MNDTLIQAVKHGTAVSALQSERRFFTTMGVIIMFVALIGFSRSFYLGPLFPEIKRPPETYYYWVHGPVFTAWFLLIGLQPFLIGRRKQRLHQTLGLVGLGVAVLVVFTGIYAGLLRASSNVEMIQSGLPPKQGWATPFFNMVTFAGCAASGFIWLRNKALHKRAMLLASIAMLSAAFARWPIIGDLPVNYSRLCVELLILSIAVYDWRTLGRIHAMTLCGGLSIIAGHRLIKPMIWKTEGWMDFTDVLLRMTGFA